MAWGWWRRRRRRWFRGLWRRKRRARGRPRWTYRRPRRRRVRRQRRWRRGRPRRRRFKKRRFRRRRKRQKIIIRQWQPAMVRRCYIKGYMAALISGDGTFATNYSSHLQDRIMKGPFGGGHSTMRFSLQVLYEGHLRHENYWTYSNQNLELGRYKGATIKFYRHPDTDFIAIYNRKTPLGGNIMTAPSLHPGNMMISKRKIVIPSLETRKRGKKYVKIRIGPPTLLVDKWYFQKDICDVTLLNLNVTECDLRFPFCSPQTNNVCISFQVLKPCYNKYLSINAFDNDTTDQKLKDFLNEAFKISTAGTTYRAFNQLNTFKTEGGISHPQLHKPVPEENKPTSTDYFAKRDALWGDAIYCNTRADQDSGSKIIEKFLIPNMTSYFKKMQSENFHNITRGNKAFCHLTGIYSGPYLSQGRISPEVFGLYTEIIYNPYTDKGTGNRIWVDALTKTDNIYKPGQSKCLLENMPLWTLVFGYTDWIKKELNDWSAAYNYRLLMISPYTYPALAQPDNKDYGFVCFSYNFGSGQMPDGSLYCPFHFRTKWYPTLFHQQAVMEDIAKAGPFAPKTPKPSTQLVMKYQFTFNWGGNPIFEQIVRDPCTQPTYELPGGGNLPGRIQVINPKLLGPNYSFRSFDIRRGQFSTKSIKRMSEQPETSEFLFPEKRPRIDLPKYEPPEESSRTHQREERPWTSEEETETEAQSEEEPAQTIREQLQQQLQEQLRIRKQLKVMFQQLIKTQQGVHVHPSLC
nr:MAG: ORF1 [Torque teno virus]